MPRQATVTINENQWSVEVASTQAELLSGLSGVASLTPGTGMLFILPERQEVTVDTSEMCFPIDIIFISESTVIDVASNIQPGYLVTEETPCDMFLEVNAGEADGVETGDIVSITIYQPAASTLPNWIPSLVSLAGLIAVGAFMTSTVRNITRAIFGEPTEKLKLLPKVIPTGTCYEDAWRFLLREEEGELIHGSVESEGKRIKHAWVELPTGFIWEPENKLFIGRAEFKTICKPEEDSTYSVTEAAIMASRTKNFGPWSEEEKRQFLKEKLPAIKPSESDFEEARRWWNDLALTERRRVFGQLESKIPVRERGMYTEKFERLLYATQLTLSDYYREHEVERWWNQLSRSERYQILKELGNPEARRYMTYMFGSLPWDEMQQLHSYYGKVKPSEYLPQVSTAIRLGSLQIVKAYKEISRHGGDKISVSLQAWAIFPRGKRPHFITMYISGEEYVIHPLYAHIEHGVRVPVAKVKAWIKSLPVRHFEPMAVAPEYRAGAERLAREVDKPIAILPLPSRATASPAVIPTEPRPRRKTDLEYLADSPEFLTQTIDATGYRQKLDNAFQEAIARVKGLK